MHLVLLKFSACLLCCKLLQTCPYPQQQFHLNLCSFSFLHGYLAGDVALAGCDTRNKTANY